MRSRNWCFTDFIIENKENWKKFHDIEETCRGIIIGKEICPDTKRKHLQGFIQFKNPRTLGGIKKLTKKIIIDGDKIHYEAMRGTVEQAVEYCKKDGDFFERGEFVSQGQRNDLIAVKNDIDEGLQMGEIACKHFDAFTKFHRGFEKYKWLKDKQTSKAFRNVEVIVLSGPTGCGKTRLAMEEAEFKIEGAELTWWDGYEGEKCILIDEYSNDVKITKLLNLLDGYQLRLPVKGSFTYAMWTKVFITTNLKRHEFHAMANKSHLDALNRRISEWRNLWPGGALDEPDAQSGEVILDSPNTDDYIEKNLEEFFTLYYASDPPNPPDHRGDPPSPHTPGGCLGETPGPMGGGVATQEKKDSVDNLTDSESLTSIKLDIINNFDSSINRNITSSINGPSKNMPIPLIVGAGSESGSIIGIPGSLITNELGSRHIILNDSITLPSR